MTPLYQRYPSLVPTVHTFMALNCAAISATMNLPEIQMETARHEAAYQGLFAVFLMLYLIVPMTAWIGLQSIRNPGYNTTAALGLLPCLLLPLIFSTSTHPSPFFFPVTLTVTLYFMLFSTFLIGKDMQATPA